MSFSTEPTAAGEQYLIPGTEVRPQTRPFRYSREGTQLVVPGAERISTREHLQRRWNGPLEVRRGQRAIEGAPLFSVK